MLKKAWKWSHRPKGENMLSAKEYGPQYIKKYYKSIRDFFFKGVKDMKRRGNLNDRS